MGAFINFSSALRPLFYGLNRKQEEKNPELEKNVTVVSYLFPLPVGPCQEFLWQEKEETLARLAIPIGAFP